MESGLWKGKQVDVGRERRSAYMETGHGGEPSAALVEFGIARKVRVQPDSMIHKASRRPGGKEGGEGEGVAVVLGLGLLACLRQVGWLEWNQTENSRYSLIIHAITIHSRSIQPVSYQYSQSRSTCHFII